jgi:hypothetical protein
MGILLLVPIALSSVARSQLIPDPETKLFDTTHVPTETFANAIAVDGDTAVVQAAIFDGTGIIDVVQVYVRSGSTWVQQATLSTPEALTGQGFGSYALAISGSTAVVGAAEAAYVFVRHGTSWNQQAKLQPSDPEVGNNFGNAVSVSQDTVIVSAPYAGGQTGAVYVFTRSGSIWSQQAKLVAGDGQPSDYLGYSVALDGDTVVAGAPGVGDFGFISGAAYAFVRHGSSWAQQAKLHADDAQSGDQFGASVALSGDSILVGAPLDDTIGGTNGGSAYVFTRDGTSWAQQGHLVPSDGATEEFFGVSVALDGDTSIVGEPYANNSAETHTGAVYAFSRSGATWTQVSEAVAPDGSTDDAYGEHVALGGNTLFVSSVGDNGGAGSLYIYELVTVGKWSALGSALAGTAGPPGLTGTGYLAAGSTTTLALTNAKSFALAPLFVGVSNLSAPFKGGVLVPKPDFIFPLFSDFSGKAVFGGPWPAGIPSGFTTFFQWWIQDPAGPKGFAASNALAGTTP